MPSALPTRPMAHMAPAPPMLPAASQPSLWAPALPAGMPAQQPAPQPSLWGPMQPQQHMQPPPQHGFMGGVPPANPWAAPQPPQPPPPSDGAGGGQSDFLAMLAQQTAQWHGQRHG